MFEQLYKKIVEEEEEDIFKASTPEEGIRRKEEYVKIMIQRLIDKGKAKLNEENGSYDIAGDINLFALNLSRFPVKFNKVTGIFSCHSNNLTSLEGGPREVGKHYWCEHNKLTTLRGAPVKIGGDFWCSYNDLTTLEGAPTEVGRNFICYLNKKKFTETEVKTICDVQGNIDV